MSCRLLPPPTGCQLQSCQTVISSVTERCTVLAIHAVAIKHLVYVGIARQTDGRGGIFSSTNMRISGHRAHAIRHCFCTNYSRRGAAINDVAELKQKFKFVHDAEKSC